MEGLLSCHKPSNQINSEHYQYSEMGRDFTFGKDWEFGRVLRDLPTSSNNAWGPWPLQCPIKMSGMNVPVWPRRTVLSPVNVWIFCSKSVSKSWQMRKSWRQCGESTTSSGTKPLPRLVDSPHNIPGLAKRWKVNAVDFSRISVHAIFICFLMVGSKWRWIPEASIHTHTG